MSRKRKPPEKRGPGRPRIGSDDDPMVVVPIRMKTSEKQWCLLQPGGEVAKTLRRLVKEAMWEEQGRKFE